MRNPNTITWSQNKAKKAIDKITFKSMAYPIMDLDKVKVLSFPGNTWRWESSLEKFYSRKNFSFIGLEQDPFVHERLYKQKSGNNYKVVSEPYSFQEYAYKKFDRRSNPFDVIYLDWMGTWGESKIEDLDAILERNLLTESGVFIMTIALARGYSGILEELEEYPCDEPSMFFDARNSDNHFYNLKVQSVPTFVKAYAKEYFGVSFEHIYSMVYYSDVGRFKASAQAQFMFHRTDE